MLSRSSGKPYASGALSSHSSSNKGHSSGSKNGASTDGGTPAQTISAGSSYNAAQSSGGPYDQISGGVPPDGGEGNDKKNSQSNGNGRGPRRPTVPPVVRDIYTGTVDTESYCFAHVVPDDTQQLAIPIYLHFKDGMRAQGIYHDNARVCYTLEDTYLPRLREIWHPDTPPSELY
ncbi:hypothetical protein MMC28_004615 [Mycoblastus sanguinarius]|nr:hypothetical protein [Mycoblastus sanguinarius]